MITVTYRIVHWVRVMSIINDAQTNRVCALGSLIFLLEQIVRLTNKSVVCIKFYLFYSSCIY